MPTGKYVRTEYHKKILEKSRIKAVAASVLVRTGKKLSEEHKKKISESYDYNKNVTPEKCHKISESLRGRKLSLEHRLKISLVQKGKKKPTRTKEHIENNAKSHRGEKSHWWKGGKTNLSKQIKNLSLYKVWRETIFKRDNWTCVWCKVRGSVELAPDHIKPFSHIIHDNNITNVDEAKGCLELWDISNGRTLCRSCHIKTDTYGQKSKRK